MLAGDGGGGATTLVSFLFLLTSTPAVIEPATTPKPTTANKSFASCDIPATVATTPPLPAAAVVLAAVAVAVDKEPAAETVFLAAWIAIICNTAFCLFVVAVHSTVLDIVLNMP